MIKANLVEFCWFAEHTLIRIVEKGIKCERHKKTQNISDRHIVVSTIGICIPMVYALFTDTGISETDS